MQRQLEASAEEKLSTETTSFESVDPEFVEVAVPLHVSNTFTYRLPASLRDNARLGCRIIVPLGRKFVTGYIVGLRASLSPETSLDDSAIKDAKQIVDTVPLLTPELIELTRWISDYYLSPWGEVLKAALPPGITPAIQEWISLTDKGRTGAAENIPDDSIEKRLLNELRDSEELSLLELSAKFGTKTQKIARQFENQGLIEVRQRPSGKSVKAKYERYVRLVSSDRAEDDKQGRKLTEGQTRVLEALKKQESVSFSQLLSEAGVGPSSISTLQKRNLVKVFESRTHRDPLRDEVISAAEDYVLTADQNRVLNEIQKPLLDGSYQSFLLHGVTGSGKTEVYIRAMRIALKLGKSAVMLVPEIALTPVFSRRLRMHFQDKVAIFHSSLSRGERFDEWTRVKSGEARVVIGTRSAVFAPVKNLGLVIVDEEHESTYRQQDSPHYNGRDTSVVRAQKESAVVILGSATPSLETFHNASSGKYTYLQLPKRLGDRPLAVAEIIDMREVFARHRKPKTFSDELLRLIGETHEKGEQSIILLNRRGYSSFVLCRSCGESIECPNCDVTLTYHQADRVIICHYCNHRESAPNHCPACEGKYIYYVGEGTQQIEEKLRQLFPTLRLARIDRDTTARRHSFEKSLMEFSQGKIDMLVGTQILAKGHDFPNVTLVGVVSVDAGLALPDFRSAERTFQLLTQVAGRAGRGDRPGRVLIQTYHPYHYALRHAAAQDYEGFYQEELRHRQNHTYPPFVALASILVHGSDLERARTDALKVRRALDKFNADPVARVLGPAPAPLSRLKGQFRIQLLVKSRKRTQLRQLVDSALEEVKNAGINLRSVNVEIDPVSIM